MFGLKSNQSPTPVTPPLAGKAEVWGDIYTMPNAFQPNEVKGGGSGRRTLIIVLVVLGVAILGLVGYMWWRSLQVPATPPAPVVTPAPAPTSPNPTTQLVTAAERDRVRFRDVREIQAALELYFAENNRYPLAPLSLVLGTSSSNVLSAAGFSGASQGAVYLEVVPTNPEPGGGPYLFESLDGTTYSLRFRLEEGTAGLSSGDHEATPLGIDEQPSSVAPPTGPRPVTPPLPTADVDGDGLTDAEEPLLGSDAAKPDSDGDGYTDGSEVGSGYDPTLGESARLITSAHFKSYTNEQFSYTLLYPTSWEAEAIDEEDSEVLVRGGGTEFIEVLVVGNPDKLTAAAWYAAQFPSLAPTEVPQLIAGGLVWALAPDGLTAYLATERSIIAVSYNIGTAESASYYALFKAMVQLFTLASGEQPLGQPTEPEGAPSNI
ncbi:MAG: hypothetical protein U1C53_02075 [Candidatus Veblenbacteria bacterium]|nr:hypothetical protein [Candidatus Veblenbacteria bacterium]MDZ4229903.1 hypothetical protein [Candidatus Veblenbacteria bacterium]